MVLNVGKHGALAVSCVGGLRWLLARTYGLGIVGCAALWCKANGMAQPGHLTIFIEQTSKRCSFLPRRLILNLGGSQKPNGVTTMHWLHSWHASGCMRGGPSHGWWPVNRDSKSLEASQ